MGKQITIRDIRKGTEVVRRSDEAIGVVSGFRVWSGDEFDFTTGQDEQKWRLDTAMHDSDIEVMVDSWEDGTLMGSVRLPNMHRRFRVF